MTRRANEAGTRNSSLHRSIPVFKWDGAMVQWLPCHQHDASRGQKPAQDWKWESACVTATALPLLSFVPEAREGVGASF